MIKLLKTFYSQPHRKYHTWKHIDSMFKYLQNNVTQDESMAIYFHDAIYDINSKTNEEGSFELCKKILIEHNLDKVYNLDYIEKIILATKRPFKMHEPNIQKIIDADLSIFSSSLENFMKYEEGIFFEYQKYDILAYITERIKFLKTAKLYFIQRHNQIAVDNIDYLIKYLITKKYKIGIYAGSFNPWHRGHNNIKQQAEQIFDKIIIAQGINQDKKDLQRKYDIDIYNEVNTYSGTLHEYIKTIQNQYCEITLIRGLRNGFDLHYEDILRQVVKDKLDINFTYFFCNKKYEHISSGMIRSLYPFGEDEYKEYL